ncbi:MAG TPA: alpha/beta hydrolase fold domain-containing protein [Caulobacteraceae bacterium]|nr:alpha/beta hydrolase fold domain-containing protein [Caulobacteraceae bacterium]
MNSHPLDPEIAAFVEEMKRDWARHPPFMSLPLAQARSVAETVRARWRAGGPAMRRTVDLAAPTASGPLPIRLYDPGGPAPGPALIYLHGGGFTLFSIQTHDRLMREYAAAGNFRVIGVEYPLSPEAPYPAALDQLVSLVLWLDDGEAATIGVDASRLALGGDSAGANLALAASLRLRDEGARFRPTALLLNYGAYDFACSDEAEALYGGPGAVLDRAEMDYYFANYLGGRGADDDPYARPVLADLADLPPAFLVIPECDILAEQSLAMAARMRAAGVAVAAKVYPGATHSFLEAMSVAQVARDAIQDSAEWLRARFER